MQLLDSPRAEAVRGSYSLPPPSPFPLPPPHRPVHIQAVQSIYQHTGMVMFPSPLKLYKYTLIMMYSPPGTGQPASARPDVRDYSELELHAKRLFHSAASS